MTKDQAMQYRKGALKKWEIITNILRQQKEDAVKVCGYCEIQREWRKHYAPLSMKGTPFCNGCVLQRMGVCNKGEGQSTDMKKLVYFLKRAIDVAVDIKLTIDGDIKEKEREHRLDRVELKSNKLPSKDEVGDWDW